MSSTSGGGGSGGARRSSSRSTAAAGTSAADAIASGSSTNDSDSPGDGSDASPPPAASSSTSADGAPGPSSSGSRDARSSLWLCTCGQSGCKWDLACPQNGRSRARILAHRSIARTPENPSGLLFLKPNWIHMEIELDQSLMRSSSLELSLQLGNGTVIHGPQIHRQDGSSTIAVESSPTDRACKKPKPNEGSSNGSWRWRGKIRINELFSERGLLQLVITPIMHVPLSQNLMTIRGIYVMAREPENSRLPSRPQQNLQHQTSPQPQTSALVPYSSQPPQQPSPQPHAHTAVQNLPQPHDQPRPSFRLLCAGPLYLQSGHPNIFDVWIEQVAGPAADEVRIRMALSTGDEFGSIVRWNRDESAHGSRRFQKRFCLGLDQAVGPCGLIITANDVSLTTAPLALSFGSLKIEEPTPNGVVTPQVWFRFEMSQPWASNFFIRLYLSDKRVIDVDFQTTPNLSVSFHVGVHWALAELVGRSSAVSFHAPGGGFSLIERAVTSLHGATITLTDGRTFTTRALDESLLREMGIGIIPMDLALARATTLGAHTARVSFHVVPFVPLSPRQREPEIDIDMLLGEGAPHQLQGPAALGPRPTDSSAAVPASDAVGGTPGAPVSDPAAARSSVPASTAAAVTSGTGEPKSSLIIGVSGAMNAAVAGRIAGKASCPPLDASGKTKVVDVIEAPGVRVVYTAGAMDVELNSLLAEVVRLAPEGVHVVVLAAPAPAAQGSDEEAEEFYEVLHSGVLGKNIVESHLVVVMAAGGDSGRPRESERLDKLVQACRRVLPADGDLPTAVREVAASRDRLQLSQAVVHGVPLWRCRITTGAALAEAKSASSAAAAASVTPASAPAARDSQSGDGGNPLLGDLAGGLAHLSLSSTSRDASVAKTDAPPKEEGEGSVEGTMLRDTAANLTTPPSDPHAAAGETKVDPAMDVATILGQVAPALWAAKTQPIGAHEDFISKFNALVRGVRLVKVPEKVSVKPFVKKEVYHLFAEHDDGRRVPLGRHEAVLGTGYAQAALQNLLQAIGPR